MPDTKPTMNPDEQKIHDLFIEKILSADASSERGKQTEDYMLGISDMGHCREYARNMVLKTPRDASFKRNPRYTWAAQIGHALERQVLDTLEAGDVEMKRGLTVKVTLPSGISISGHPDALIFGVLGDAALVLDVKTKNGTKRVQREGADLQQQFQRRLYGAACRQMGLVTGKVIVGNIWFDRAAAEDQWAWVELELLEDYMLDEVDQWITDVTYAVTHDEPASRDMPHHMCELICPFFETCRGPVDPPEVIDDPNGDVDRAAEAMREARALEREAADLRRSYRDVVEGLKGKTARYSISSTHVAESPTPPGFRAAHTRVVIRDRKL